MAASATRLGAALATAVAGVSAGVVRGVAEADQAKYQAGADGTFKCFAGGASVPLSSVNDDFCDCADGSDEPGTAACGGKSDTLFYCPNENSVPAYLYPSRINDGVCDCCDGSDEWRGRRAPGQQAPCANTCTEEGKFFRKERERRESEWRKGLDRRKHLVDFAVSERRKSEAELASHRQDLPALEAAEAEAAKALAAASAAFAAEEKQKLDAAPVPSESSANSHDAAAEPAQKPAPATEEATPPATLSEEVAPAAAEPAAAGGAVVSEYTKWMEGAEQALDSVGASDAAPAAGAAKKKLAAPSLSRALVEEDDYEDDEEDDTDSPSPAPVARPPEDFKKSKRRASGFFGRTWANIKERVSGVFGGVTRSPAERARDAAEDTQSDAAKALKDKRKQIEDLEKRVGGEATDGDDKLAYHSLNGKCISKKITEYKYDVCFFKNAKQDSTSIGNWNKWESPGIALFTGGQHCPGGPPRSLRVVFRCGPREEIEDVSEPSRCAYQTTIMHPAACTDEPPDGAGGKEVRPRMPTDEL